jgi:S-adenosylmethionine:tRNA ribosyltransferase-isomerase
VRTERVEAHRLHAEWFDVGPAVAEAVRAARARRGRVVAVGTTVARALESCSDAAGGAAIRPRSGHTSIFLYPGHDFRFVDALVTNFHLPRSTLLMLVCALAGRERVLRAYREAIARGYRFYSYGDAMFVERAR